MSQIVVENSNRDGWGVIKNVPYNGEFIKQIRSLCPGAKWVDKQWQFRTRHADVVMGLLAEFFDPENQVDHVVYWEQLSRDIPRVDGVDLAFISRDSWKWRGALQFDPVVVDLRPGGSRANPGLYGRLVVKVKARRDAVFTPEPSRIDLVDNGVGGTIKIGETEFSDREIERLWDLVLRLEIEHRHYDLHHNPQYFPYSQVKDVVVFARKVLGTDNKEGTDADS